MDRSMKFLLAGSVMVGVLVGEAAAQGTGTCGIPPVEPIVHIELPSGPFTPVVSPDGCWIFVALTNPEPGIAVISRQRGAFTLERTVPVRTGGWGPTGATLTHDGETLIAAAGDDVAFLDAGRLMTGEGEPVLGYLHVGEGAGAIYVSVTEDDRTLFVALELSSTILMVDLDGLRTGGFREPAEIARVSVGIAPVAVTLSLDEKYLFTTSQAAPPEWGWDVECRPEHDPAAPPHRAQGAVVVLEVARARDDPGDAVVARVPVGCNPVRLVLAPDGNTAWITVRGDHDVVAVDTRRLVTDPDEAVVARIPVGMSPVGVAVLDDGRHVIVTNSNRFAGDDADQQWLNVLEVPHGPASVAVVGTIPSGAFPRELRVTPDGTTLLATNFRSRTLQVIDLGRLERVMR